MAATVTRRQFLEKAGSVTAGTGVAVAAAASETPQDRSLKIIGICGSPRKARTTATALQVCLDAAKEVAGNIEVELLELAGMSIPGQLAADLPLEPGQRDDFPELVPKLTDPKVAGIIIGTPVYFGNMTALCKAFLDRCITLRKDDFALSNKVAGVVAVGAARNGGQELTIASVQAVLMCHEMVLVGDGRPTGHRGATVWSGAGRRVTDDEFGMSTCRNLGRRVAEVALQMASGPV